MCIVLFYIRLLYSLFVHSAICYGGLQNTRSDKASPVMNRDRQRTSDRQSPHNELRKHHSSHNLKNSRVCLFVWRLQSDTDINAAVSSVRWKQHQRPSLAIAWIPANGLCDIQTVTDGYKTKGSLLFSTEATAHSARDHQTDVLCAVQHILDSCDPPSCPRSPRLLGWHPRQKSHHPHDMVAPRPWRPLGHKSSTYSERAEHLGWLTNWLWQRIWYSLQTESLPS